MSAVSEGDVNRRDEEGARSRLYETAVSYFNEKVINILFTYSF